MPIRFKKKYYRLKNGSFINLADNNIEELTKILASLNMGSKNIEENKLYLENSMLYILIRHLLIKA